jgi:pimeloyl-ACP methyl ester carboxylesterase
MYKKIFFCVFVFVWVFPPAVLAALVPPFLNFTINQTVAGQDVNFNFSIKGYAPALYYTEDFAIQTANGAGSYTSSTFTGSGDSYYITQSPVAGLPLKEIVCTSDNPSITFNYLPDGVRFNAYGYSSVECSFKNISEQEKTPLLIIPGTTATEIFKGDTKLWLDIDRLLIEINDRFMDPLAFIKDGTPIDETLTLGDVLGNPKNKFDYSESLVNKLKDNNYKLNQDLFLLSYDWRKEISENANGILKAKVDELVSKSSSRKIDIVAHSQGGLLIKRLIYNKPEYSSKINKLIFVGTPNLGSPKSFKILRDGDSLGISDYGLGLDPGRVKAISQNMPAIYEMLPSREYFNHYLGYWGELDRHFLKPDEETIYNYETTKQKQKDSGYNEFLLDLANVFHIPDFDNFNFSSSGIDVTNIVGCQTPTYAGFIDKAFSRDRILWEPGDETVPLKSATNIFGVKTIYSTDASHATMLTNPGIKQKIINLVTGSNEETVNTTENLSDCKFNGTAVASHSPVDLHVYDSQGRHVGVTPDGGFDSQIPGVGFEVIGHENFAYLPEGLNYTVKLVANGGGSFTFDSSKITQGEIVNTAYYDSVNIATSSVATINLENSNSQPLKLDFSGDGTSIQTILPSSFLNQTESKDLISPISTSTISGLMGEVGSFRGDVVVTLSAEDVLVAGKENETSGVLGIKYSLDGGEYLNYSVSSPINITTEGEHKIKFFATDRAGNNEQEQEINFVIDKTPPEFVISFDPNIKDLVFSATDTLQTTLSTSTLTSSFKKLSKIKDQGQKITATDAAGNVTILTLTEKDRKKSARAEIKSLNYKGVEANIKNVNLAFWWQINKAQKLTELHQIIKNKKQFTVYAYYKNGLTKILGKDQNGVINKTVNGLNTLNVSTNKGDINWSFNK